jgi:hypothetical protein
MSFYDNDMSPCPWTIFFIFLGYRPDSYVTSDEVARGRPGPAMIYLNMVRLDVFPVQVQREDPPPPRTLWNETLDKDGSTRMIENISDYAGQMSVKKNSFKSLCSYGSL